MRTSERGQGDTKEGCAAAGRGRRRIDRHAQRTQGAALPPGRQYMRVGERDCALSPCRLAWAPCATSGRRRFSVFDWTSSVRGGRTAFCGLCVHCWPDVAIAVGSRAGNCATSRTVVPTRRQRTREFAGRVLVRALLRVCRSRYWKVQACSAGDGMANYHMKESMTRSSTF